MNTAQINRSTDRTAGAIGRVKRAAELRAQDAATALSCRDGGVADAVASAFVVDELRVALAHYIAEGRAPAAHLFEHATRSAASDRHESAAAYRRAALELVAELQACDRPPADRAAYVRAADADYDAQIAAHHARFAGTP